MKEPDSRTQRPTDRGERRRQTNKRTKTYKDTTLPDWEYERLLAADVHYWHVMTPYLQHIDEEIAREQREAREEG
jgi:hypothetical protein